MDSAEQIALVVSNDGGQSFTHTIVASLGGDGCDSGRQDFPSLAFDETTNPPQGFLVWRNRQHESFGGCVQSFFIDDTGTPQRIGLSHTIGGMDKSHGGSNEGQGFLKVVAADHAVTVVYASDASIDNHICGTPLDHVPTDMGWGAVTSFDDGANWSEKGNTFLSTNSFLWCSQKGISRLQRGLKEFDAALGPDGNLFVVAVVDDTHMRLVMSPMRGVLAHGAGTKNDLSWREWCPLAAPPFASRWRTTIGCTSFEFQGDSIMRPTLSFDTNGRLLISYYHKSTMNPAQMQFFVKTITAPRAAFDGISDFQPEQAIGNPFEMFGGVFGLGYGPNDPLLQKTGGQPDIDSANSLGWQNAIVAAGALFPFPQGPRPFFVFYTEGLSSDGLGFVDNVAVQSARVDFSPAP